jgi:SAM-dependent methyltransferase
MSKHLDIGCGRFPRNPYMRDKVYAVDIFDSLNDDAVIYKRCDIGMERLPFDDAYFDSVSAYDFLEHLPRVAYQNNKSTLPFIHAMNEIYRVLKPEGVFLAITPAYPKESAFVDPTHVNIITKNTHKYFTIPDLWGSMYGFNGKFEIDKVGWVNFDMEVNKHMSLKRYVKKIIISVIPKLKEHYVWKFRASK